MTTPEEQFTVGESDFAFFGSCPYRIEGGALLFCRGGSAVATIDQYRGEVRADTMLLLLPGSVFLLADRSADFRVTYCAFSLDLRGGLPARSGLLRRAARAADRTASPAARGGRFDLVPDGRLHLPRPGQHVP